MTNWAREELDLGDFQTELLKTGLEFGLDKGLDKVEVNMFRLQMI